MSRTQMRLIQEQLDEALRPLKALQEMKRPFKGWIKSIRSGLGMSSVQLAGRMGVKQPRIAEIEKGELAGSLTLRTLDRVAEALGCELVYALVPKAGSLEKTIEQRAREVASKRVHAVSQSMRLEDQGLSVAEEAKVLESEIRKIIRDFSRRLWD